MAPPPGAGPSRAATPPTCAICMRPFSRASPQAEAVPCAHNDACMACSETWFASCVDQGRAGTCPFCRQVVHHFRFLCHHHHGVRSHEPHTPAPQRHTPSSPGRARAVSPPPGPGMHTLPGRQGAEMMTFVDAFGARFGAGVGPLPLARGLFEPPPPAMHMPGLAVSQRLAALLDAHGLALDADPAVSPPHGSAVPGMYLDASTGTRVVYAAAPPPAPPTPPPRPRGPGPPPYAALAPPGWGSNGRH